MNVLAIKSYYTKTPYYLGIAVLIIVIAACFPTEIYTQDIYTDFDNDGVSDLFDIDVDNDGIINLLEGRCSDSLLYNWEEAANPAGDDDFTWVGVDGYRLAMNIKTTHPTTVDNLGTPQTSSGYLEMGMNVSDVSDDTQISVYELTLSEPSIISSIAILDIDSQTGFTFTSYGDGVTVEFFDAFGVEVPAALSLGQALTQNPDGIVVPSQLNVPAAISNQSNWATYSSNEYIATIRITYYSIDLNIFDDPGSQYIYIGDLSICTPEDSDNDGIPNYADLDSDNDGILDAIEACGDINIFLEECSLDANGDAEYLDVNLDNIPDGLVATYCVEGPIDTDDDTIPDYIDLDSDNDGCADSQEALTESFGTSVLNYVASPVDPTGLLLSGVSGNCNPPINTQWIDVNINEVCTCDLVGEAVTTSYCSNNSNRGSVEVNWSGGRAPYRIVGDLMAANLTTPPTIFDELSAGEYQVTIVDAEGCESVVTFTIQEFQAPFFTAIESFIECDAAEGNITFNWSSGEGPFELGGDFTAETITSPYTIEDVIPGSYYIEITDVNGCQSEFNIDLEPRNTTEILVETTCEGTDFYSIQVDAQESIDIYTEGFEWVQLSSSSYQLTQIPITVSITVTTTTIEDNCDTVTDIMIPDCSCTAVANLPPEATLTCNDPVVIIDIGNSSVGPIYSYRWLSSDGIELSTAENVEISEPGTYTLEVIDNLIQCSTLAQIEVSDNTQPPAAQILAAETILTCNQPQILLSALPQDNVNYAWTIPGESTALVGDEQLISDGGLVTLFATDLINGCTNESSLNIQEDFAVPPIDVLEPEILNCNVIEVLLEGVNVTMSTDLDVQWIDSNENPIGEPGNFQSEVNTPGLYILESTNLLNGCEHLDSIEVQENIVYPMIDLVDELMLTCALPTAIISPDQISTNEQYLYSWSYDGQVVSEEQSISVSDIGTYMLNVTHADSGCDTTTIVEVVGPEGIDEVVLSLQDPSCFDSNDGVIDVVEIGIGEAPFQFFLNGTSTSLPIENLSEGSYELEIIDADGCSIVLDASLLSPPAISLMAAEQSTYVVPYGDDVAVLLETDASNVIEVEWIPSIDCSDCLFYEFTNVTEDQAYRINLVDASGCEAETEITILVEYDINLFFPNILVYGNGDSVLYPQTGNDQLYIDKMSVYDRWGNLVFESSNFFPNDPSHGWNGTNQGSTVEAGVYVYHVQYSHPVLGAYQAAGDVTFIR